MTTFVTGATGHIGANLVRELLKRGEAVRALIRGGQGDEALDGLDVDRVRGDIRDRASLERAMRGCDRLFHLAALISLRNDERRDLFDVNVLGTRNVFWAAERAGIEKSVHCSSFGAIGHNAGGASDETFTLDPFEAHFDYELSKAVAEIEVLRAVVRGLPIVIVNPTGAVGPYDFKPSPLGRMIVDFANRRLPAYLPGRFEFVAIGDVVRGHLLAMEKGRPGERYILGGEVRSLDQIFEVLQETTGAPKPRWRLPPRLMLGASYVSSFVLKHFFPKASARITPGSVRLLTSGKRANLTKAKTELGYRPSPVDLAFREACRWFEERGQLGRLRSKSAASGDESMRADG